MGIAVGGYDDPQAGTVVNPATGLPVIKNYSFFPLYPYVMKAFIFPLQIFGLNPIATGSLAGVVVALLGTLAGLFALYDLGRDYLDKSGGLRAVFYLLIFPTGFFLAQVYTEGLFIGLAFWSLALTRRKRWLWASLLAVLAAWTRAHGAALVLAAVCGLLGRVGLEKAAAQAAELEMVPPAAVCLSAYWRLPAVALFCPGAGVG